MRSSLASLVVFIAALGAAGCGPPEPYVRYQGHIGGKPKYGASAEVYRTNPPPGVRDLGTVVVTCPTEASADPFGGIHTDGGCSYEWAVWEAGHRALLAGADGIHSIETSISSNGNVVSLRASAFVHAREAAPPAPKASSPSKVEDAAARDDAPSVEERLRRLEKLRDEKLITPEEYAAKRAEILKDI